MPVRTIIEIDEDKCDGCGICIDSCHEGALALVDGKAKLVSDIYCDGLGDCLKDCPQGAIRKIQREADEYSQTAVDQRLQKLGRKPAPAFPELNEIPACPTPPQAPAGGGCPGSAMKRFEQSQPLGGQATGPLRNELGHWPVQLMLVPPHAPFLKGADLLICADCVPFAVPDFHSRYLAGKAVVVGCPKLDNLEHYFEKLTAMFAEAQPRTITVLRMEVPCCGGIAQAAVQARDRAGLTIPVDVYTVGIRGGDVRETHPASAAG